MKTLVDREDLVFNPPELGCALYLPGLPGGGSKIYDRSPYGNIGTITGATWIRLPSGLWCLSFDGQDDYVDCGDYPNFDVSGAFTLLVWLNTPDYIKSTGYTRFLFCKRSGHSGIRFGIWDDADWGKLFAYVGDGSSSSGVTSDANNDITPNVWHQVGVVFIPSTSITLYLDTAVLKQLTTSIVSSVAASGTSLYLGSQNTTANKYYKGYMSLAQMHWRALNALEIQNHFNREKHLFGVW